MRKMLRSGSGKVALGMAAAIGVAGPPAPASAQIFLYDPPFPTGPIEPNDPLVGLPIPGATPEEYRAHMVWNLRSGLNVAALQCQFSPYLRTVDNYNSMIAHHSRELAAAYRALEGYFRRVGGRNGPRQFDLYSTQTYNGFSALQAQLGFCQIAARIGKEALTVRKGGLTTFAATRMREFRSSLTPVYDNFAFNRIGIAISPLTLAPQDCRELPRRERRACQREQRRR